MCNDTYKPSDDTFLLMDLIELEGSEKVMEIGTGSGIILAYTLINGASYGVGIDVNPYACISTMLTLKANNVYDKADIILCNGLTCINKYEYFDVIIFNPPYTPGVEVHDYIDLALIGGPTGKEVLIQLLPYMANVLRNGGKAYIIVSEPPSAEKVYEILRKLGFKKTRSLSKKFFYETIHALELVKI